MAGSLLSSLNEQQVLLAGMSGVSLAIPAVPKMVGVFRLPRRLLKRGPGIKVAKAWIPDDARVRHTHIVGATGSGKTVLLEQLLCEDLRRGYGALIVDPKGDRELFERVRFICKSLGRTKDLHFLSATFPDESVSWNPCGLGNVSELQTKFFNSAVYEHPHYAKWAERALLEAFNELVVCRADGFVLTDLVAQLEEQSRAERDRGEKLEGLFLDLYNLAYGEWASLLTCVGSERKEVSLLDLTEKNEILFVDLPTEAKKVQSARIGRLITQELMLISGLRKIHPGLKSGKPFSVYIDEADAFATESLATFLNKGRSSDFMIHLAHQTLSDLNKVGPDFAGQIMGNCNVRWIFRQDDPDDAERWSRFIGTESVVKKTYQTQDGIRTGMSSNRSSQEFVISPDTIKSLRVGEAVLSIKTEGINRQVRVKLSREQKNGVPADKGAERRPETRGVGEPGRAARSISSKRVSELVQDQSGANVGKQHPTKWSGLQDRVRRKT